MEPFIISCEVYPFDILVHVGHNSKKIKHYFSKEEYSEIKKVKLKKATTIMFSSGKTLLWLKNKPKSIDCLGILAHEIFHSVCFILQRIGCKMNKYTDEPYAYLIQFITIKIYERMKFTFSF